jgi:hypothetical protein
MPIVAADFKLLYTGTGNNMLGGAVQATEVSSTPLHNIFDKVTAEETTNGLVTYRCLAIKNTHATLTPESLKIYFSQNTKSTNANYIMYMGKGTSDISGTEQTIANTETAPIGVTFMETSVDGVTSVVLPNLAPNQHVNMWFRLNVAAGSPAVNAISATITINGSSPA